MINDKSKKSVPKVKRVENFKDLMDEIKPYIKEKKYIRYSTAGKWILTGLLNREEEEDSKMRSALEDFKEKLLREEVQDSGKETEGMNLILEFIENDKGLYDRILTNAAKTIKTIQPSILFSDFTIALAMIEAVVAGALSYLKEEGYLTIKAKEKG